MVARGGASRGVPWADMAPAGMAMLQDGRRGVFQGVRLTAQGGERFMPPRSDRWLQPDFSPTGIGGPFICHNRPL